MNLDETNIVRLTGKIMSEPVYTHSVFSEGFYEMLLEVPRLSDQKDVVPITMSERLMALNCVDIGREISIVGQFRSYNKLQDNRSKLMLTVFVLEFEDAKESVSGHRNPNEIILKGFICKQPIYRTTPFKREICDVLLAVNRAYNKSDYIPCIAWGRNARFVQTINIGDKLIIHGRIQSRTYQKRIDDETSETRTAYEVSIGRIETDRSEGYSSAPINEEDVIFTHELA